MKLIMFILMAVIVGYTSGLMAESMVEGEYSKVNSLVATGEFDERWIPFNLSPKITEFVATYGVLSASMGFLDNAEMSDILEFDSANIDFVISTAKRTATDGTKYLVNRISECIFETDDFVATTCIVCLLKNSTGDLIAKGQIDVPLGFNGPVEGPVSILMTEFDTTNNPPLTFEADITDVRNVHAVSLAICEEEGTEGCSAKFWKENKKQWPSSYDPKDKFIDVFGITVDIKIGKTTDPTLEDALKAKGKNELEFLAREAVAALLSAEHTAVHYPLLSADIILDTSTVINAEFSPAILSLVEEYADLNDTGCLLEKCKCEAVTRLLLEYTGPDDVTITVKDKDNIIETFLHVDSGDTIEVFPPAGQDKFKANTIFEISDNNGLDETIAIHTSCSRAIAVDQEYTDDLTTLTIKELDQTFKSEKGEVCPLAPLKCEGVERIQLKYFALSPSPVTITVHEKADEPPFAEFNDITTDETFDVFPPAGKTEFKANTIFKILDESNNNSLEETATKHTSCSKPIAVDDIIGFSLIITELDLVFE